DGRIIASALPLTATASAADRSWYRRALASRRFAVGDFEPGSGTSRPAVHCGLPLLDPAGGVRGVLYVSFVPHALGQVASANALPADAALLLIDRRGTVISRLPDSARWSGRRLASTAVVQAILRANRRTVDAIGLE